MRRLTKRILALPNEQRRLAVEQLQGLVTVRRAEVGPKPLNALELALQLGIQPDPWQTEVLSSDAPRLLLNCSRQTGKSTVTALLAVHTAHFQADSLVLLLSPSLRQSQELALELHRRFADSIDTHAESALRLELKNGSRILSLPGKEETVRGYSGVRLLAIDEAARVPSDLYLSIRPMLAVSGGRLIALSTPYGTRGWWYEAWRSDESWERFEIPAWRCPRISHEFLDEERRTMGQWWFA